MSAASQTTTTIAAVTCEVEPLADTQPVKEDEVTKEDSTMTDVEVNTAADYSEVSEAPAQHNTHRPLHRLPSMPATHR
jgi:hypothetical protein